MGVKLDGDIGADPDIKHFEHFVEVGTLLKYTRGAVCFNVNVH